jgi:shikimate dehydrogenase
MPDPERCVPGVTGRSRLLPVLGDPVAQVQAPSLLNGLLAKSGIDVVVIPAHVRRGDLDEVLPGLQKVANLAGLLITIPHKVSVLRHADVQSRAVQLAGSANAMRRQQDGSWHAENFDGAGFLAALIAGGYQPSGKHVALAGAGGAGAAVAAALLGADAARIILHDVDRVRLKQVADHLGAHWPGRITAATKQDFAAADIVVNATPVGLQPTDPLPFEPAALRPGALVADLIMEPEPTRLLHLAATLGHPVLPGKPVLQHQMELYLSYFGLVR